MRYETPAPPAEVGKTDGLAYPLWLPEGDPWAGVVVLHGARSCKESHHDFARAAVAYGLAAITFDHRGHGASDGPLDGRMLHDVTVMGRRLRAAIGDQRAPIALRGSSMGGYLALVAAATLGAGAVVAICPATATGLARGLRSGAFGFPADGPALEALLDARDERAAAAALGERLLLLHAEGDDVVPVMVSRELHAAAPGSRLVVVPGGHHRSAQHDPELQDLSVRFVRRVAASGS
jgi:pimeloyl-ACP methyl ester carboxylesterase